jgi:hypothetical protein
VTVDPFNTLYASRPKIIFNTSLRNSGAAHSLAELARTKGYEVEFARDHFRRDVKMHVGWDSYGALRDYTLNAAMKILSDHPGVD